MKDTQVPPKLNLLHPLTWVDVKDHLLNNGIIVSQDDDGELKFYQTDSPEAIHALRIKLMFQVESGTMRLYKAFLSPC